jgi:mRNA-degrading endonuclease RelE of RelBE toxin-antitoxin system/DNA helicase IV
MRMAKQNNTTWLVTMKPNFVLEIAALPAKEAHQIWEKIHLLMQDPTPDAMVKKQFKYMHGKLHRIRSGKYRIFYTFAAPYISLLTVRYRDDDTYDEDLDPEFLGGLDPQWEVGEAPQQFHIDWGKYLQPVPEPMHALPSPVTAELLGNLRVPASYHSALLAVTTEEELFASGVPDEYIINLHDYLCKRPLAQVVQQPDLVLNEIEDLARYKEGELLGFLLKLSPEQEKYVNWALKGQGPALLKGSPGTGKSTIALYRVRALIKSLRAEGRRDIRILFTTYTNALARSSRQLLAQLLGSDLQYVEVQTADKLVRALLGRAQITPQFVETPRLRELARQAIASAAFTGNALQQYAQRQTLQRLSHDYLLQEFQQVIVARQLRDLEAYQRAARPGRQVRLNALQREAVWQFAQTLRTLLEQAGLLTWTQARALAAQYVEEHQHDDRLVRKYDAVLIDEAQDLDPTVLRLLVQHCVHPQRLFITADANQSIYGSGFNWSDIHANL